MILPKYHISTEKAIELIVQDQPLFNYYITGNLDLYKFSNQFNNRLTIKNCIIENLVSPSVEFANQVNLINSHFYKCSFNYAYFLKGLIIDECIFDSYLDFEAGGHNQKGNLFSITNSNFCGFVNFFDCWFQSRVVISDNNFQKGTNLLGNKKEQFRTSFDIEPIIKNNIGLIDIDGEGDKGINLITLIQ